MKKTNPPPAREKSEKGHGAKHEAKETKGFEKREHRGAPKKGR